MLGAIRYIFSPVLSKRFITQLFVAPPFLQTTTKTRHPRLIQTQIRSSPPRHRLHHFFNMGANFVKHMSEDGVDDVCDHDPHDGGHHDHDHDHDHDHGEPTEEPEPPEPPEPEPPEPDHHDPDHNPDHHDPDHNPDHHEPESRNFKTYYSGKGRRHHGGRHHGGNDHEEGGGEDHEGGGGGEDHEGGGGDDDEHKEHEWHSRSVVEIKCAGEKEWCVHYFRCRSIIDHHIAGVWPEAKKLFKKGEHVPAEEEEEIEKRCKEQRKVPAGICVHKEEEFYWYVEAPYIQLAERLAAMDRSRVARDQASGTLIVIGIITAVILLVAGILLYFYCCAGGRRRGGGRGNSSGKGKAGKSGSSKRGGGKSLGKSGKGGKSSFGKSSAGKSLKGKSKGGGKSSGKKVKSGGGKSSSAKSGGAKSVKSSKKMANNSSKKSGEKSSKKSAKK